MSERERFEQYMRDRYGDISLEIDSERGWYDEIAVRFAWSAWQARADIEEQGKVELVEVLKATLPLIGKTAVKSPASAVVARAEAILAKLEKENQDA